MEKLPDLRHVSIPDSTETAVLLGRGYSAAATECARRESAYIGHRGGKDVLDARRKATKDSIPNVINSDVSPECFHKQARLDDV